MTVADFARFLAAQDGERVLSRAGVATLTTPSRLADGSPAGEIFQWSRYGLGVGLDDLLGEPVTLHSRAQRRRLRALSAAPARRSSSSPTSSIRRGATRSASRSASPGCSSRRSPLAAALGARSQSRAARGIRGRARRPPARRLRVVPERPARPRRVMRRRSRCRSGRAPPASPAALPRLGALARFELLRDDSLDGERDASLPRPARARHDLLAGEPGRCRRAHHPPRLVARLGRAGDQEAVSSSSRWRAKLTASGMHRMREAGIAPQGDLGVLAGEGRGALLDPRPGDVRVGVAASEVDRGAREVAAVVEDASLAARSARRPRRRGRPSAADGAPRTRSPGRRPARSRARRSARPESPPRRGGRAGSRACASAEESQGSFTSSGARKRCGYQVCVGRLRRQEDDPRPRQRTGEAENVRRRGAAPVDEDDRGPRLGERRAGGEHRRRRMRVGQAHGALPCSAGGVRAGSPAAIAARCGSSQGGRTRLSPSFSGASSTAKPGPSVASSKSTPPGSLK